MNPDPATSTRRQRWISAAWIALAAPAFTVVALDLWTRTTGMAVGGRRLDLFAWFHYRPGTVLALLVAYYAMGAWSLAVAVSTFVRIARRRPLRPKWMPILAGISMLLVALPWMPVTFVEVPYVSLIGPGSNGGGFLAVAGRRGSRKLVQATLRSGVSINSLSGAESSAIHAAALAGDAGFVAWLIDQGADVNLRTLSGQTPLMYGVDSAQVAVVRMLVARGADARAVDYRHESVLDHAVRTGNESVVSIIRDAVQTAR